MSSSFLTAGRFIAFDFVPSLGKWRRRRRVKWRWSQKWRRERLFPATTTHGVKKGTKSAFLGKNSPAPFAFGMESILVQ